MTMRLELLRRLGNRVREQRLLRGYSQEKLAEKCGFDRTYISLIERGLRNPSYINLLKLAKGLGISVSELTARL